MANARQSEERGERVGMVRVINKRGEAEWGMGWIGRGDTQYLSGRRAHIGSFAGTS